MTFTAAHERLADAYGRRNRLRCRVALGLPVSRAELASVDRAVAAALAQLSNHDERTSL